ncbi:phage tail protein [Oceanospirillum sediminis]|uniref:Phage tail protein n=1 Tax=Oceanospirillum sediminis TaxID=2760088 RepID=A0A839IZ43_9GAMM|nr:phage tail protein [Oceanospirillum sediminis]MBB1489376.1 phage tail protein [Oceanospirillum sediminis]
MPLNPAFERNGISIITSEPFPPLGPPGADVVCLIGTAPDKHASVQYNVPVRIANSGHWRLIDSTGDERGSLIHAIMKTHEQTQVVIYAIVVEEGADFDATTANIIGGRDPTTNQRLGIAAARECTERPTIIAAPGFSHQKAVIDQMAAMGAVMRARVVADGLSTTPEEQIAFLETLGGEGSNYDRVYMVEPAVSIYSRKARGDILVPASVVAVGALASVKQWESPGNQSLPINGTAHTIEYGIMDETSEANLLQKYGCAVICHTSMGGWSLIGNRTVTGKFISYVGLEDAICRKLEETSQRYMAKNMTKSFWDQTIRRINGFLKDLIASEIIPGGEVYLHPELNTASRYQNGSWYIVFDYGRYAPNEHMIYHVNAKEKYVEEYLENVLGEQANG